MSVTIRAARAIGLPLLVICVTAAALFMPGCGGRDEPSLETRSDGAITTDAQAVAQGGTAADLRSTGAGTSTASMQQLLASLPPNEAAELRQLYEMERQERARAAAAEDEPTGADALEEAEEGMPKWFEPTQEARDLVDAAEMALRMDLSDEEKLAAIEALDGIDHPVVIEPVMAALDEGNVDIREAALDAVMELNDPVVVPVVEKALDDEDPEIREYALDALLDVDDEKINTPLMKALDDENYDVRDNAMNIMLYIESPNIIPSLDKAFLDSDEDIREMAIITIEDIPDPRAVDILIERGLLHEDETIREDALDSLEFITDQEFKDYNEARRWWDRNRSTFKFDW